MKDDIRVQRDFLTLVRCMLCLVPRQATPLKEKLEDLLNKLSCPGESKLIKLNSELALILSEYQDEYISYHWMRSILALYLDKNISEIESSFGDSSCRIDINTVKSMCDIGRLDASLEIHEEESIAYINLSDTETGSTVVLKTLP